MSFLTQEEKSELVQRIQQAESRSTGEIVTVIAARSDSYRYIPLLWSALVALSVPGLYYLWQWLSHGGWVSESRFAHTEAWLYTLQALTFLGLGALFSFSPLRMLVIPRRVKLQRAARHAREQFFLQNLHLTRDRSGILIFVSVAEHYVEIIVDSGISAVVDNETWVKTVNDFVEDVRAGHIARGFGNTVEHCREVLWEHFPAPDGRPDELPNHLIEV